MSNNEYQLPKNYPNSNIDKIELVTSNFATAYVKPLFFNEAFKQAAQQSMSLSKQQEIDNKQKFQNSYGDTSTFLGRQILTDVKLKLNDYDEERFDITTNKYRKVRITGTELVLNTVLVEIQSSKNIIQTAINGMQGTVKEFISNGDYEVTISGAIVSSGKGFPFQDVQTLNTILKAPVAIEIESELLSLFNIFNLVVKSDVFPSKEGFTNTQLFSFSAVSDEPLELKL